MIISYWGKFIKDIFSLSILIAPLRPGLEHLFFAPHTDMGIADIIPRYEWSE